MSPNIGGWFSRLGFKIAAWSLLLAAIVGTSATIYQACLGAKEAIEAARHNLSGLADNVELATTKALWELDNSALEGLLDGLVRDKFVAKAEITGPVDGPLAASISHDHNYPQQESLLLYILPTSNLNIKETRKLVYPFEGDKIEVGTLTLTGDVGSILAATVDRANTVARTSAVISITIVASLLISVFLIVTRPLRTISEYLQSINIDKLNHVSPLASTVMERRDDIGTVAQSIDTLLRRILRSKKDLEASEERYRGLLEGSLQGVTVLKGYKILYANQTAAQIFGYENAEEFVNSQDLRKTFPSPSKFFEPRNLKPGEVIQLDEEKRIRADGSEIILQVMLRPVLWEDDWAIQSTLVDVTSRAKAERELRRLATRDTLTGLANRTMFRETVLNTLKIRPKFKLAVILININRFKAVNDLYGHDIGDEALKNFSERLGEVSIHSGLIARLESDKFAVLLDRLADTSKIVDLARRVHNAVKSPIQLSNGETIELTASIGASVWPTDCNDADELIRTAEIAMFAAKSELSRDVKLFDSSLDEAVHRTLSLEKEMREALVRDEFELVYQPKIDCSNHRLCGCEALVRWPRPDGSYIPPSTFIPIAEATGLIIPLGQKVMDMAAAQAAKWQKELNRSVAIAVNVSAVQFTNSDVLDDYRQAITAHNLSPDLLQIEVTESATMQSLDSILPVLKALKDMGTAIAIDDFGTGYSSLSYLKKMPVTHLKLDRTFVMDLPESDSRTIAKAIVTLGHALNLKVVAEGVETNEQASLLREYGYNEFQGYRFAPPLSPSQFEDMFLKETGLLNDAC
mgnify:CR=1 FL=1